MKYHLKRALVISIAAVCIVLGLAGLVLPFLQGLLLLLVGVLLLSLYSPAVRRGLDRSTVRWPRVHHFVQRAEAWVARVFGPPEY